MPVPRSATAASIISISFSATLIRAEFIDVNIGGEEVVFGSDLIKASSGGATASVSVSVSASSGVESIGR